MELIGHVYLTVCPVEVTETLVVAAPRHLSVAPRATGSGWRAVHWQAPSQAPADREREPPLLVVEGGVEAEMLPAPT